MPSVFAWKVLGTLKLYNNYSYYNPEIVQAAWKKFETERKTWAEERTALLSRAEKAEAALTERTAELSGLKRHVSQMVSAIFGKSFCKLLPSFHSLCLIRPPTVSGLPDFV